MICFKKCIKGIKKKSSVKNSKISNGIKVVKNFPTGGGSKKIKNVPSSKISQVYVYVYDLCYASAAHRQGIID